MILLHQKLSPKYHPYIQQLNKYSMAQFLSKKMRSATIRDCKGLGNEVIIVVDLPPARSIAQPQDLITHYVAMSRAGALLVMICLI